MSHHRSFLATNTKLLSRTCLNPIPDGMTTMWPSIHQKEQGHDSADGDTHPDLTLSGMHQEGGQIEVSPIASAIRVI